MTLVEEFNELTDEEIFNFIEKQLTGAHDLNFKNCYVQRSSEEIYISDCWDGITITNKSITYWDGRHRTYIYKFKDFEVSDFKL